MPRAIIIKNPGDASVMQVTNIAEPKKPGSGQVLIRQEYITVNYIDIHYRSGLFKTKYPFVPGMEAVGIVEEAGSGCQALPGQRVAYATVPTGAYCEKRILPENFLVGIPDNITSEVAAASLGKGLTAHYLLYRTYRVKKNTTILVHAVAGGTGQLICQWAKKIGAKVIGTISTQEKAVTAAQIGCDHPIVYTEKNFAEEVLRITEGAGVPVVYDSVGAKTFTQSLQSLAPLGLLVSYGQSSGMIPPFNLLTLAAKGLFVTRPTLTLYKRNRMEFVLSAVEVYNMITSGAMKVAIDKIFPLEQAQEAHQYMEERKTKGSVILKV